MNKVYYVTEELDENLEIMENTDFYFYTKDSNLKLNFNVRCGIKLNCHIISLLKQTVDYHINVNHESNSESNLIVKVITEDAGELNAIINDRVAANQDGVILNQQIKILAVNQIMSQVKPNLLIASMDTMASHGVSIGNVSSDSLYYLMTKGLSLEQAKEKLIQGFILGPVYDGKTYDFFIKEG